MPQENLRKHPLCRAEDLGKRIPDTPHAASMCLPRWQDVIGYEEKDPETMQKLQLGYPRFFYHPLVEQAFEKFTEATDEAIQIYSSDAAAKRCKSYLLGKNPRANIELRGSLISFPSACADDAKDYWQHAGEGISSRCAEDLLQETEPPDASDARNNVIRRLAEFSGTASDNIYLFPTGMAAIHAAYLALQQQNPKLPTVQFSFPYGDTLKLQNKLGKRPALFYPRGDASDLADLETKLKKSEISGLFCEFPTNPLLTCVDLPRLRELADTYAFPIIIDETLGACINQDSLPYSDVSIISLTKYFSGSSEVLGGALILNPDAPFFQSLKDALDDQYEPEALYASDLIQLDHDSVDCRSRVRQINETAHTLCTFLKNHPAVESVYYPAFTNKDRYDRIRRPDGGYGGLFSFVLKEAEKHTEVFYDALEITKGPNLGTSFSLCCPFTLIAHYHELDWAESAGASRWLIRISAGLEPADELITRIKNALSKSTAVDTD